MKALGAAAQDCRVARFQAQRARISGHVRAAFVDHADDTERGADTLDVQSVRAIPLRRDFADGVGQGGNAL